MQNPDKDINDYQFNIKKMSSSGCLFDIVKLGDVSKNVISRMTADQVYDGLYGWASEFEPEFAALLDRDPDYAKSIISIGRGGKKPRKDYGTWAELKAYMELFYDEYFAVVDSYPETAKVADIKATLTKYLEIFDVSDDQNTWFDKIKSIAEVLGYATDMKAYKSDPTAFPGSVADVSMFLRVAVTGKLNSPDMFTVMQILGENRVKARINNMINSL